MTETIERHETRRRRWPWAVLALLAMLGVGAVFAAGGAAHAGFGHRGHHGFFGEDGPDEEAVRFFAGRFLGKVDADDAQVDAVVGIVMDAMPELLALRDAHRARRDAFLVALTGEQVDREAIEALRAAEIEAADAGSARLVRALGDIAEVLTPEQRYALAELHESHRGHWR